MTVNKFGLKKNNYNINNLISVKWIRDITLILLLVAFSLLHKANTYSPVLFNYSLITYGLTWFAFMVVVFLLFKGKIIKTEKSIIYALFTGFFLMNYGEIQNFLLNTVKSRLLAANWSLLIGFVLLFVAARIFDKKANFSLLRAYNFILILFTLFTLVEVVKIFTTKRVEFYDYRSAQPPVSAGGKPESLLPDIYYLIFDSYTSPAALTSHWNFTNADIDSFLTQNKFKVTHNAHSLYDFTALSINSTFNLNPLPVRKEALEHNFVNFNYGRKIFDDAFLVKFLKGKGYQLEHHSMVSLKNNNNVFYPFAPDEPLHWLRRQTIEKIWLEPSLKKKILSVIGLNKKEAEKKEPALEAMDHYNKQILDTLLHMRTNGFPRFVYAHFMLPHGPFIYNRNGSLRPAAEAITLDYAKRKTFYLDQVIYTNTYIRQIVSSLLKDGKNNKVVIIQGDHGHREFLPKEPGDPYAIMNAVYFPDGDYSQVSDSMLAVNTFRIVLNKYFNQQLSLINALPVLR